MVDRRLSAAPETIAASARSLRSMRGAGVYGFIAMAIAAGVALPIQASINARLRVSLGGPLRAAFASFLVGAVVLGIAAVVAREPWPGLAAALRGPAWMWAGGALGAFYIFATIVFVPRLGPAVAFALVVAGQMAASLAIDQFGFFGVTRHELSLGRVAGAALLVAGVVLIRK